MNRIAYIIFLILSILVITAACPKKQEHTLKHLTSLQNCKHEGFSDLGPIKEEKIIFGINYYHQNQKCIGNNILVMYLSSDQDLTHDITEFLLDETSSRYTTFIDKYKHLSLTQKQLKKLSAYLLEKAFIDVLQKNNLNLKFKIQERHIINESNNILAEIDALPKIYSDAYQEYYLLRITNSIYWSINTCEG